MSNGELNTVERERRVPPANTNSPTWRYLGDRTAADLAYCARFGVQQAPEPTESLAGVWSYALPATLPLR